MLTGGNPGWSGSLSDSSSDVHAQKNRTNVTCERITATFILKGKHSLDQGASEGDECARFRLSSTTGTFARNQKVSGCFSTKFSFGFIFLCVEVRGQMLLQLTASVRDQIVCGQDS